LISQESPYTKLTNSVHWLWRGAVVKEKLSIDLCIYI